jgi:hypothetical protein
MEQPPAITYPSKWNSHYHRQMEQRPAMRQHKGQRLEYKNGTVARHEGAKVTAMIMEQWSEAASQHSPGTVPVIQVTK